MKRTSLLLAPVLASVALVACTSTTSSPAVVCGPDNVATTNADVVAAANYEAALYYGALDPVPLGFYTVADVSVGADLAPSYGGSPAAPVVDAGGIVAPILDAGGIVAPILDAGGIVAPILDAGGIVAPIVDAGISASSAAAASAVAASAGHYFENGCATATASGNVVTFTLDDCTGPLGLVGTSGIVTATLNVVSNSVQIQLAGSGISANGATLNLATSGTLTATAGGQKTLQASSQTSGTGADGNSVMHTGTYSLVWPTGSGCATLNGTLSGIGSDADAGTTTQITSYVACTDKCPQSGMTVSSFNGGSVTLSFNGSNNAQCTSSLGTSASIGLNCP
jgi:hypothetical protein